MPIGPLLWGIIISVIPWVLNKVFKALGLAFVTYVGMTVGIEAAESFIFGKFDNIGTELYQILVLAGIPQGIKILFSAFAAALVLKNAGKGDRVRRPYWQKPGPFEA